MVCRANCFDDVDLNEAYSCCIVDKKKSAFTINCKTYGF